jgi:hypothetical protein
VFPGFSVTFARPAFSVTSTPVTPSIFRKATLTAWAHTAQSMPKIDKSICRYSADALAEHTTAKTAASARTRFMHYTSS